MEQNIYVVRGFIGGRRQPEERFTSEARARRRAAYLGMVYDAVIVGSRKMDDMEYVASARKNRTTDLEA
jgi:ribosomal protein L20A (L18A)